jgi:hypothetical protein
MQIAVITGDIVHSRKASGPEIWLGRLKSVLNEISESENQWEIFRGDSFQVVLKDSSKSLYKALQLRSGLLALKPFHEQKLDLRIAIGVGEVSFEGKSISESTGSAFLRSGKQLDMLKDTRKRMAFESGNDEVNKELEVSLLLADSLIQDWSHGAAEIAWMHLTKPSTQTEYANRLKISQPAVHKRILSAHLEELEALIERYAYLSSQFSP